MVDSASFRPASPSSPAVVQPRYVSGRTAADVWAHFPSGKVFEISRGRARAYPGLPGAAPSTMAFYAAMHLLGSRDDSVLDIGCGAGVGTARLVGTFDRVVGLDVSKEALAFASEYCPKVDFLLSGLETPPKGLVARAAIIADVLGHAKDPTGVLESTKALLEPDARVLVAEPAAYSCQVLMPPARRAFSKPRLEALLCRAGFEVSTWVADDSSFSACVAVPFHDEAQLALAEARRVAARDGAAAALAILGAEVNTPRTDVRREWALFEAELRLKLGDGDGTVRALLLACDLDPRDARPPARLAEVALATGSLSDAMHLALRAVELDATEPSAAKSLALAADRLGHEDALGAWRIAARLSPDHMTPVIGVAQLAASRGDCALGIQAFEKLRQYGDPLGADFFVTLALLLEAEGRRADALLEAHCARTLAPEDPTVVELCRELERG